MLNNGASRLEGTRQVLAAHASRTKMSSLLFSCDWLWKNLAQGSSCELATDVVRPSRCVLRFTDPQYRASHPAIKDPPPFLLKKTQKKHIPDLLSASVWQWNGQKAENKTKQNCEGQGLRGGKCWRAFSAGRGLNWSLALERGKWAEVG